MGRLSNLVFIERLVNSAGYERFSKFCIKAFSAVTLVAVLLKYMQHQPGGTILLIIGMGGLGMFAYLSSFRQPKVSYQTSPHMTGAQRFFTSKGLANFMCKLDGYGTSLGLIGLLFKLNHWPGGTKMLYLVVPTLLIVGILHLVKYLLTRDLRPTNYKE